MKVYEEKNETEFMKLERKGIIALSLYKVAFL